MKAIGIHTIVSYNYGNRLQNYALQTILNKKFGDKYKIKTIPKQRYTMVQKCKNIVKNIIRLDKETMFRKFDKKINWGHFAIAEDDHSNIYPTELSGVEKEYCAVAIGSDQIWNITFDTIGFNNFLPEILKNKKISYAASFGIKEMPQNVVGQIAEYLKDIEYVSVREDAGARLYKKLTGRDCSVVLDPTLLLTSDEWKMVAKKPLIRMPDKFILTYFLGDDTYGEETQLCVEQYKCKRVNISNDNSPIGPAEFIWLISNAEMVCTDSFHASVFSLIFKKPFVVFERKSNALEMSSRLDTLCDLFELEHHRYSSQKFNLNLVINDNYSIAYSILMKERQKSIQWLENAMKSILHE